jgi:hypothetical protein
MLELEFYTRSSQAAMAGFQLHKNVLVAYIGDEGSEASGIRIVHEERIEIHQREW